MSCYIVLFEGELIPASEIAEIRWITSQDISSCDPVAKCVLEDLLMRKLID